MALRGDVRGRKCRHHIAALMCESEVRQRPTRVSARVQVSAILSERARLRGRKSHSSPSIMAPLVVVHIKRLASSAHSRKRAT